LATQTGLIGRSDAFGAQFRHQLSKLLYIVLRSAAASFSIGAAGDANVTARTKAKPSRGDIHRQAIAAGDERA
jgi:hypothetical protein